VLSAYDTQLDRKVAVKLVRPDVDETTTPKQQVRLLREAKALARLTHPNVVTVYEAGTCGDQVFVVMEYVEGQTLRDWLAETPRPRDEILHAFLHSGRGVAAAHQAGLVHRDFKPENVLVGKDGRIRVSDFGIVSETVDPAAGPRPSTSPSGALTQ